MARDQATKIDTSINWSHFLGGGIGGTVGAVLTCPLEVVKTRLQVSYRSRAYLSIRRAAPTRNSLTRSGTFSIVHKMYTLEGIGGLFKGIGPNLVGVIPSRAISFATYGNAKRIYTELNHNREGPLVYLSAAATAGIVTATATNPIWLVKTRMQLQSQVGSAAAASANGVPVYRNSLHCLYRVAKDEGLRGLYKGLTASYLGVAESAIQWVIYEQLKKMIPSASSSPPTIATTTTTKTTKPWLEYFGAAGTAKFLAAVITYPHEVLRTRLRQVSLVASTGSGPGVMVAPYRNLAHCFSTIVREEGVAALYGGMTAHLLRTVPNAAIMFFCYEFVVQHFG
ncbi:mitochondrial carrier domain-containing protein [Dimargaris cristalligena]|uniref:Mitochondrial carrier domain-containing protein n=1 Tax=Dimargaris cristalligena TaxID=215637 RepID=A0A4P9ZU54_9FUNG|nr:mitochondrial carrier domain-containing protein [Dimargaris cristalligena]|eukprot:RKP37126.1 mitochondrial carrier domain-containing protein [Dimargaris cristalligena]